MMKKEDSLKTRIDLATKVKLFSAEWKKLSAQKNFRFMLAVFLALQVVFFIIQGFRPHQEKNSEFRKILSEVIELENKGDQTGITKLVEDLQIEKEDHLNSQDWFSPEYRKRDTKISEVNDPLIRQIEYVRNFKENNLKRIDELNKKLILLKFDANPTFSEKTFKRQIIAYENLSDLELQLDKNRGVDILKQMSMYNLIGLIFIFWLTTILFKGDQDDNLTGLVRSLPLGAKQLIRTKAMLLTILGFVYALLIKAIQFGAIQIIYGFGNLNRVIQSNSTFNFSTYKITIGEFILYDTLYFLLTALFFVSLSIFFSSIFQKKNTEIYALLLVFTGSMALCRFVPEFSIFNLLKFLNPVALIDFPIQIEVYKDLNFIVHIATRLSVSLVLLTSLSVILMTLGIIFMTQNKQRLNLKFENKLPKFRFRLRSLPSFELWHSLFKNKTIIFVPILVFACIKLTVFEPKEVNSHNRAYYLSLIEPLEGVHTEYKEYTLEKRIWELENQKQNQLLSFSQESQNEIEIYEAIRIRSNMESAKLVHEGKKTNLYYIDEAKGNTWFNFSDKRNLQAIPMVFFMFAYALALVGPDKKFNMISQIRITPNGQKYRLKVHLRLLAMTAILSNIIFTIILYLGYSAQGTLLPLNAAIQSVIQLLNLNLGLTFNGLEMILFFYRFLSLYLAGLSIYLGILKFDRVRTTIWLGIIFVVLPTVLNVIFEKFNVLHVLPWANSVSIYGDQQYMSTVGFILLIMAVLVLCITLVAYIFKISDEKN